MSSSKYLKFWFPVILYSGIIFWVSALPNLRTPLPETPIDKLLHVLEYIPFGFLTYRALFHSLGRGHSPKVWWLTVLLTALYALSDEFHQMFVPGRTASAADVFADIIGGMAGAAVTKFLKKY